MSIKDSTFANLKNLRVNIAIKHTTMSLEKELHCETLTCRMGYTVKVMMRSMKQKFEQENVELTLEQYFILNILDHEEGLILQELAEIVERDNSAVLRHLNKLEKHHFVTRAADPEDKRRKLLIITKPGVEILEKARKLEKKLNDEVTRNVGNKRLERVMKTLSEIYAQTVKAHEH